MRTKKCNGGGDQDLCAWWCQRCLVEIKGTVVELCFSREFRIDIQGMEEIQSGGGLLFDESTPQMEREIWIGASQNGSKMIFPGGRR
jgi:hypothetical protein